MKKLGIVSRNFVLKFLVIKVIQITVHGLNEELSKFFHRHIIQLSPNVIELELCSVHGWFPFLDDPIIHGVGCRVNPLLHLLISWFWDEKTHKKETTKEGKIPSHDVSHQDLVAAMMIPEITIVVK